MTTPDAFKHRRPSQQYIYPVFATVILVVMLTITGCTSSAVLVNEDSGEPAPVNNMHTERLTQAMAGLRYSQDRVTVDSDWIPEQVGESAALKLIEAARQAQVERRRLAALRAFTDAVLAAPWMVEPYEGLALSLIHLRQFEQAVAAYRTALELAPTRFDIRFEAAKALQAVDRLDEAIEEWLEVIDQDPEHGEAHGRLAVGYFLSENFGAAQHHLERALDLGAKVPEHIAELLSSGTLPTSSVRRGEPAGEIGSTTKAVTIGSAVRIDTGGTASANETTIAASDPVPDEVVAGWNDWRDGGNVRVGVSVSLDGGATWADSLLRPPAGSQSTTEGDPMTAYDHRTGNLWAGGMSYYVAQGGMFVARKQPGATTFEPPVMVYPTNENVDKGWMGTGPRPGVPDSTRLFLAYSAYLHYSDDLGDTWSSPVTLDFGYGHLPRVGPSGELYVAYWDLGVGINFQVSLDGGDSVSAPIQISPRVDTSVGGGSYPGSFRVWPFTYITVDRSTGTLYSVWNDVTGTTGGQNNVDLLFSVSTDQGSTWTTPAVINGDSDPPGDQFFPWLEVDASGRLHMMFFDTRHNAQTDNQTTAWIDAYYSYSEDGGASWTEHRLSEESFSTTSGFIGDYCGLTVAGDHIYPVYPSTVNGNTDIFTHTIVFSGQIFADGFESGNTSRWSSTSPN
ncbi:MAG: hypothetical protein GY906_33545 [bacterium]|nr:hypothetical protein [bacterium]